VIGGENFELNWHTLDDVWIYNIEKDSLRTGAKMPAPRSLPTGTLINGKIYAIGGHITPRQPATKTVEVYDIEKNSWDTCASIPTSRVWHAACVLDGKIYVLGGLPVFNRADTMTPYTVVERYDPESDTWDSCAPMPTGRWCLSACALNGKIYAIGGYSKTESFSTVEVYDPATDQWTSKQSMNFPRGEMGLTVRKGQIYAISGSVWDGSHNIKLYQDFEVYDPVSDRWTLNPDLLPRGSIGLAAVTLNERIYVASGVGMNTHPGIRELYMYDYPVATIETRPYLEKTDTLHAFIHEDSRLYLVPDGVPPDPDSIVNYQIVSWDVVDNQEKDLFLEDIPVGSYLLYAVSLDGRIAYHVPQITIVQEVPEIVIQVIDEYTMEKLSDCQVYLNGKLFEKDSEDAMNVTGWAYDTCNIRITKDNFKEIDTTVVVNSDTTLVMGLQHLNHPELFNYSDPLLEKTDLLKMMMTQHGWIYVTPEGTPAVADSITKHAAKSVNFSAGIAGAIPLFDVPPGTYMIYGISLGERIANESYKIQVIDYFPECVIQVRESVSNEILNSCLLVLDGKDTIPGNLGEFDLTGLVFDTCNIKLICEGYHDFDTTLVVLSDTIYAVNLVPMIIENIPLSDHQKIRIYPNPAHDLITVQTLEEGIHSLEIINLSGQVVNRMDFTDSVAQVDFSPLPTGIYIIRIISGEKVFEGRVVKY
jgi:N-acetylneuraminic acid mutarotase